MKDRNRFQEFFKETLKNGHFAREWQEIVVKAESKRAPAAPVKRNEQRLCAAAIDGCYMCYSCTLHCIARQATNAPSHPQHLSRSFTPVLCPLALLSIQIPRTYRFLRAHFVQNPQTIGYQAFSRLFPAKTDRFLLG
jgi:hypothetical protein